VTPVVATLEPSKNAQEKLIDLRFQIDTLKKEAKSVAVDALKEVCQGVFAAYPTIEQFAFVVYGGEYNDEGAYPGVNAVLINDEVEDNLRYDLGSEHPQSDAIKIKIQALGEDILVDALGEHHMVVVTRETISVETWRGY
jgi:hypothetical protein